MKRKLVKDLDNVNKIVVEWTRRVLLRSHKKLVQCSMTTYSRPPDQVLGLPFAEILLLVIFYFY